MLNTKVENLDDNKVKLFVEVAADRVKEAVDKVYKRLAHEVRIDGFRQGKAPRAKIRQVLGGDDYAFSLAVEDIINETYGQAVDGERLRPTSTPEFGDLADLTEGESYSYEAVLEVRPEFKLSDTDVEIVMPPRETTEGEVDAQIENYRERLARLEPVEGRALEQGDFTTLSFTSTIDGETYEGGELSNELYEIGAGILPEDFDKGIIGANAGDKVEVEFAVPEAGGNAEYAGKTIHFKVEIHDIKEKVLPELDAEFAATAGFETMDEMRAEIRSYIESQKEQSYDRQQDDRLVTALTEKLEIEELPQGLIEERKSALHRDLLTMLEQNNLEFNKYLELSGISMERYQEDLALQADTLARNDVALETLSDLEGLSPDDEALEKEFAEIAGALNMSVEDARKRWESIGMVTTIIDDIKRRNALNWLRENATVKIEEGSN